MLKWLLVCLFSLVFVIDLVWVLVLFCFFVCLLLLNLVVVFSIEFGVNCLLFGDNCWMIKLVKFSELFDDNLIESCWLCIFLKNFMLFELNGLFLFLNVLLVLCIFLSSICVKIDLNCVVVFFSVFFDVLLEVLFFRVFWCSEFKLFKLKKFCLLRWLVFISFLI